MPVTLKRNCSSSVREYDDKVVFGDFTIVINGDDYKDFMEIYMENFGKIKGVTLMEWLIYEGLATYKKYMKKIDDIVGGHLDCEE